MITLTGWAMHGQLSVETDTPAFAVSQPLRISVLFTAVMDWRIDMCFGAAYNVLRTESFAGFKVTIDFFILGNVSLDVSADFHFLSQLRRDIRFNVRREESIDPITAVANPKFNASRYRELRSFYGYNQVAVHFDPMTLEAAILRLFVPRLIDSGLIMYLDCDAEFRKPILEDGLTACPTCLMIAIQGRKGNPHQFGNGWLIMRQSEELWQRLDAAAMFVIEQPEKARLPDLYAMNAVFGHEEVWKLPVDTHACPGEKGHPVTPNTRMIHYWGHLGRKEQAMVNIAGPYRQARAAWLARMDGPA
jgi:hypothetical protein